MDKIMLFEKTKCIPCKLFAQPRLFSSCKAFAQLYNFTSCKEQERAEGERVRQNERERSELKTRDFKN